jgi:sugar phosphate isomerase/epimerase
MTGSTTRREFLARSAAGAALLAAPALGRAQVSEPLFRISLAQWSLNKAFFGRGGADKRDPLRFAEIAKAEFGIDAVEYVNQFYAAKKKDEAYLKDLKKVADDSGVKSILIMCDGEGNLGDPDDKKRQTAVENHYRWVEWTKFLGGHSIRVNAATGNVGTPDEQMKRAADGLRKLTEWAAQHQIGVIVENHGGLSSNGAWLAGVMKMVNLPGCGTLPDFGNFRITAKRTEPRDYDIYKGVDEMMPYAKGVSAKSYDFDARGNETTIDYQKMLDIVLTKHKYRGFIGIEYEGDKLSEPDGIRATKKLLETVRDEMSKK